MLQYVRLSLKEDKITRKIYSCKW